MAGSKRFPLVGGRVMRVTRLDGCGRTDYVTDPARVQVVSDGFVSIELSANVDEGDAITVKNAAGKTCISEQPAPQLTGYGVNVNFCRVDPDLYAMMTGQKVVLDPDGTAVGFRVNTAVDSSDSGFGIEVWSRVPGVRCPVDENGEPITGVSAASGYTLLPFLQGGVIGDYTIENDAVTFVIQGAQTKDGAGWGFGPYDVTLDAAGKPGPLLDAIEEADHLHVQITYVDPPEPTDGAVGIRARAASAGTPGSFVPAAGVKPNTFTAANTQGLTASPSTAWTAGQYVQGATSGESGKMSWNGTAWVAGAAA